MALVKLIELSPGSALSQPVEGRVKMLESGHEADIVFL